MDIFQQLSAPPHLQAFMTSLAIGLLIGLERERRRSAKAGLRTFALVALLGTLSGMLAEQTDSGWILAGGLLAVGAMIIAAYINQPDDAGDPGTTSVVAILVCYCLGAAVWFGYGTLAVMLGIATTVLLYFKAELHGISHRLTPKDLISILQFAVLSFVILPILPDRNYGPYAALNPHQAWLMVVLVSGVSLAGYAALRLAGPQHGAPMMGLLGGLVSSTATTVVFSRHARAHAALARSAMVVIMIASLMVLLRLTVGCGRRQGNVRRGPGFRADRRRRHHPLQPAPLLDRQAVGRAGCHRDRARRAVEPDFQGRPRHHPGRLGSCAPHPACHAGRRNGHRHRLVSRLTNKPISCLSWANFAAQVQYGRPFPFPIFPDSS